MVNKIRLYSCLSATYGYNLKPVTVSITRLQRMAVSQKSQDEYEPAPALPISAHSVPDICQSRDFTHDRSIEPACKGADKVESLYKERMANPPTRDDMKLPITLDNYKSKFTALLYYEELERIHLLRQKCDGAYNLVQHWPQHFSEKEDGSFYYLEGMSSTQVLYAMQVSDQYIHINIGHLNCLGKIIGHLNNKLFISFEKSFQNQSFLRVKATFKVNHRYFDGLHEVIKRISMKALRRILPEPKDFNPPRKAVIDVRRHLQKGIDLDPEQISALEAILSNQCSAPVLVPGAFGCGKTRLFAVATECFFREHRETGHHSPCRILICCHHQNSADLFIEYFKKNMTEICHVTMVCAVGSQYEPKLDYHYVQATEFNLSQHQHENAFLLVTTFDEALNISRKFDFYFFTHIIINNGAQICEPKVLSPFLMANEDTQIVIAGDHCKVDFVFGKDPQQFGLNVSLLQRLIERYESFADCASQVDVPLFSNHQSSHALSLTPQQCQKSPLSNSSQLSYTSSQRAMLNEASASKGIIVQKSSKSVKSEMQLSLSSHAMFSQKSKKNSKSTLPITKNHQNKIHVVSGSKVQPITDYQQPPITSPKQQYLDNWPSLHASLKCAVKAPKNLPSVPHYDNPEYSKSQKRRKVSMNLFISDKFKKTLQAKTKSTNSYKHSTTEATVIKSISSCSFRKHSHCPINEELLAATLTPSNYKEKFHQLLCREEDEHERILRDKCNGLYDVKLSSIKLCLKRHIERYQDKYKSFYTIWNTQLDADTIAYAMQASEGIVILHLSIGDVQADILQTKDKIYFLLGLAINPGVEQQSNVNVTFVLKYSYFDRLHQVLDNLPQAIISRLMPSDPCNFSNVNVVFNNEDIRLISCVRDIVKLEYSQRKALHSIMSCEADKAPVIIVGSFGTGKTRLLARAAYQILLQDRTSKILICAHHQHSADTFMANYFSKMIESGWRCGKVIRLVPSKDYDAPLFCAKYYATIKDWHFKRLDEISVIVTTFSTSVHMLEVVHEGFFSHILLDEGAQTREPESVAPLCFADDNTKIVIAGDHKQVGPSMLVLGKLAIKNGLSLSLLERLYTLYNDERLIDASSVHSATLLTNFRCHHAILSLPSYLFYDSTLITAAKAVTHLHPEAKYPLHFICSDLSEAKEVRTDTNEFEVTILLQELSKYVKSWPDQWGEMDLSKICVMATTAHQKSCVIKALFHYSHLKDIDVRTVFDIQGCEYEAIFLSTAEPTTKEGKSKNPTKTPCSQYVFNTALTRAKSLVVCAGNPFLLMTIEESMGNECSCWKEYIRRCILSKTFVVPSQLQDEASQSVVHDRIKMLQKMVFKLSPVIATNFTKDSILKSFQLTLKSIPQYKRSELLKFSYSNCDILDFDDSEESQFKKEGEIEGVFDCELQIKSYRSAIAIPLDQSKEPIVINGLNNRRGAFNNDIVQVEVTVFNSHSASGDDKALVQRSGRVVKVIKAQHPTRYVCRADQYGFINFYPFNKTVPIIANLPKISRKLLRYRPKDDQAPMIHDYITVFREDSIFGANYDIPRIKELIPFELSQNFLFVVEVLQWKKKHRTALGAVIEAVPRTSNIFFTNHLLNLVYNIQEKDEEVHAPLLPPNETNGLHHYNRAFTIDPPLSKDLDDAVSLTPLPEDGNYELAVLIANVAKRINENHPLDKKAKQRGTSVYGAKQRGAQRVHHMFPSSITSQLSLDYLKKRHVLCVPATVVIEEGVVTSVVSGDPKEAMVTSQIQFTYESAKKVMHNEEVDVETRRQVEAFDAVSRPSLLMANTLNLLYEIAMYLRIKRLGDAGYCYDRPEEDEESNWQTHLLIEELMIFCNAVIAEYLHDRLPQQSALFLAQLPILKEEKHDFVKQNQKCLQHSLSLKCYLNEFDNEAAPLILPNTTLHALVDACSRRDHIQLASILNNNKLYPQLAMAEAMSRIINRKASYIVIENSNEHICADHPHTGLLLPTYTHFTSPIRRYADLVVQRLVISLIEGRPIAENSDKINNELCSQLNVKSKAAKDYERADNKACITRSCEASLERAEAFVIQSYKNINDSFELSFSSNHYQCIHGQNTSFSISDLNSHHKNEDGTIVWKIVSISLCQSFSLFSHPDVIDMLPTSSKSSHCSIAAKMYQCTQRLEEGEPQLHWSSADLTVRDKAISLSPECWLVTHQYLKYQNKKNFKEVKSLILQLQQEANKVECQSKRDEGTVAITYEIQRPFTANDIVTVWLGKSLKECLPVPAIQLMEIAPTVRVCLQHNKNPSLCFFVVPLQKASLAAGYHSIEQYVELWSKMLIAESANESVKTKNLIFIRHANLKWNGFTRVDDYIDDPYYKPNNLSLVIPPRNQDSLDFISIKSGDFLCVRYEISDSLNAVYHFAVTSVERESDEKSNQKDIVIRMCAEGDHSCRVTENMYQKLNEGNLTCEIQLIPMPDSFHRVHARLKKILKVNREWSSLSKTIAISDTRSNDFNRLTAGKKQCEISLRVFNDDPLARQLWRGEPGRELNAIQQDSIKRALRNRFQLIQGPPGTGKSETGAHLAYVFAITNEKMSEEVSKKKSVLYCGPSNKSVDVVHKNLHLLNRRLGSKKLQILRIYGRSHERKDYPDPVFDLTQERTNRDDDDDDGRVLEMFRDESLHKRIRNNCPEIVATENRLQELLDQGIIPSLAERKNYKKLITDEEKKEIQKNYDVILCTCNETCSQRLLRSKDILAQCIIDESGMATEPETIAASSLCEHVVLIGDHKQLQPVVMYPPAKECGLGTSLFEKYANQFEKTNDPRLITLELQYRMHSFICQGPSSIFYDSKLKADQIVKERRPLTQSIDLFWSRGQQHPVMFLKVYGIERSTDSKYSRKVDSHSKCNEQEVKTVLKCIKKLVMNYDVKYKSIAVLTPYEAQKSLVLNTIKNDSVLKAKWKSLRVATIVESQGDEYDIVILTTVRSQEVSQIRYKQYVQPDRVWFAENLGFLTNDHQINVGITRARYGLIIIGNDILLKYDPTWNKLIEIYEREGCICTI
uniref:RNB domain-containing protein n=1 Tax=Amphimedon queenslandica TaxID=400682 RepID=A0A1X7UNX9_AMPQE